MQDRYKDHAAGLGSPITHGFSVTPNDSNDLPELTRALYVGSAGAVSCILASGAGVTISGVAGGTLLPFRVLKVRNTGTTAGGIVGLV